MTFDKQKIKSAYTWVWLPGKTEPIVAGLIETIKDNWIKVCHEADLSEIEQKKLWGNSIFNPFCFYEWR